MNSFAIPQWESTALGDEMCSSLFKVKGGGFGKFKDRGMRKNKFQNSGKIEKIKKKQKKLKINQKVVGSLRQNFDKIKNMINKEKTIISDEINISKPKTDSFEANVDVVMKTKRKKRKLSKKLLQNLENKVKNVPRPTHVTNIMKSKLNSKQNSEINELLLKNDDSSQSISQSQMRKETQKKRKRKKLENLKNDMDKQIKLEIVKVKGKMKKRVKKSEIVNGINENISKVSSKMDGLRKPPLKSEFEEDVSLLETSKRIQRTNKKRLPLRQRMLEKLKASRFRYLNEQIYSSGSKDAQQLFMDDPESFEAYHEGYRLQVNRWPVNPVDIIIKSVKKMPKTHVIADFGCGDAKLSEEVEQKVHSFDFIATNERVTACDMANVPLKKCSVDVVVFCLSLMGINLHDYLKEANRVLKEGGILKIAEVESRFDNVDNFIKGVQHFGFQNTWKDLSHNLFYFIDFKKTTNIKKTRTLPTLSLHPCLYKKR